ncbi:MAG TPA: RHS repeat-associated core domain-containing protein [Puia sp.]|nr:RHS repeat-associated core domain-containing protein [Puia sp.]
MLSLSARAGNGGGQVKAIATLDGSLHQIKIDSSRTVEDSVFFNPAFAGNIDSSYSVQNEVTLMINEASSLYLRSPFTVKVRLRISYTTSKGDTSSTFHDFIVGYDSAGTYSSRSSFVFSGAHKVTITVVSDSSNVSTWDPNTVLVIENQLITRPRFTFNCSNTVSNITINPSVDPMADELPVTWTTVLGADQYDLEWTFIDSSALADTVLKKYGNPLNPDPVLIFRNNATRVTTSGTSYNIPLIYDNTGTLFIRVRPTQSGKAGSVTAAIWSSEAASTVMGQYIFRGHERPLNWQSNISFAEEGKRKVVLQYYDGSLRNRQTVTKDNTTNTTIVGETYYDYQGRPAIQVMPSPTLSNTIQYTANFNVSINGQEYSQSNYDTLSGLTPFCNVHADPMVDTSGASLYYSPLNPTAATGLNQFIPNAHNYPFTETEYTPDNTGRISRQGGVDSLYQLGNGHETKYFYGTPDQGELDGLFGTEVGDVSHYFKNMVRDANGQYSVSYVDMHGRTIATALAGPAPLGMTALPSNTVTTTTDTLASARSVFFQGNSMISQKSLLVPTADTFRFNYNLTPAILSEMNCQSQNICYTCRYDLEIRISDNCNNQLLGGKPYDTVLYNFSVDSTNTCTPVNRGLNFSLLLPEGSYLITKKLTVSSDAYNFYRDSVYLPNNTCTTVGQFIAQQKAIALAATTQCAPTCKSCLDGVGNYPDFLTKYIVQSGSTPADTVAAYTAYQNAIAACSVLCSDSLSDANDIRSAMLQDMSPPYGQYADTTLATGADLYSIFYITSDTANYLPLFQLSSVHYTDDNGNPDSVYDAESGLMVHPNELTVNQFVQNFRPSWANALLPYHPEYCRLQALEANRPSDLWNRKMEAIDTYQEARDSGWLNPTGSTTIDAFPIGHTDPLSLPATALMNGLGSTDLKNALEAKLQIYQPVSGQNPALSMWSLACVMVNCDSSQTGCVMRYGNQANGMTSSLDFDATMCDGDKDQAWKNFRQLYLGAKQSIFNQLVIAKVKCTPANSRAYPNEPLLAEIYSHGHQPEFSDVTSSTTNSSLGKYSNVSTAADAASLKASVQKSTDSFYTTNCNAMAQQWAQQLSVCTPLYTSPDFNQTILPGLVALCRAACDSAHPFGASTLPPGVSITVAGQSCSSFQDIINHYNQANGITDVLHCNADLITFPLPYGNQPVYSNKPVYSRPSDCECGLINDLFNKYTLGQQAGETFSAYLLRTQQITMTDADLTQLRTMCANTTNSATCKYLSNPIYLPPAMQCYVGPTCVPCQTIDSLNTVFRTLYPSDTPSITSDADTAQVQKNIFFQNFMNNRLGFSMQTWQYLQFMDSCVAHASDTAMTRSCLPTNIAELFNSGAQDAMYNIVSTPDGGYVLVGVRQVSGAAYSSAYMIRYNSAGVAQWTKTFVSSAHTDLMKIRRTSDDGYVAVGTAYYSTGSDTSGKVFVVRVDGAGKTLWQKAYGFGSIRGELAVDIIQTRDGGYAIVGDHDITQAHSGPATILTIKLDSTGTVLWAKNSGNMGSSDGNDGYGIAESNIGDTLYVTGRQNGGGHGVHGVFIKMKESDGSFINSFVVNDPAEGLQLINIEPYNSGFKIYNYTSDDGQGTSNGKIGVLTLSLSGAISNSTRFDLPPGNYPSDPMTTATVLPTFDGGWLIGETAPASTHIYWVKMDASGNKSWSRMTYLSGTQTIGSLIQNPDSSYTALGTDNGAAMLLNLSSSGSTGCKDSAANVTISTPTLSVSAVTQPSSPLTFTNFGAPSTETPVVVDTSFITCPSSSNCYTIYNGPLLCGKAAPLFPPISIDSVTTCTDSTFFSVSKGTELSKVYNDSLTGDFERRYNNTCLQAYKYESFTVTHKKNEYHYTLYYYDQAGNLLKTVPPAGVRPITDANQLKQVAAARAAKQPLVPAHTLVTNYRYNTLNQVVSQKSPDGGTSYFWYDRLGRLTLSQNARQRPNNQYSYTQYDTIGRIIQVGQLVSAAAITDSISRGDSTLLAWENNVAASANQITVTTYDTAYAIMSDELSPSNLRNRVSGTMLYNTAADLANGNPSAAAATYYSYDILGNVDTLVQDYSSSLSIGIPNVMNQTGNRHKKLVYDYDLVSGKVNQVTYQHGEADAFYHKYLYDAENRITNVQSSTDSVNWDNDAFYSYYAHGPLARTVLGEQQVQGVNYAYTLQGWLKAINPAPYTGGAYTLRPDSVGNIVAGSAYNLLLNYHDGDYAPISGVAGPDSAVNSSLGSTDYRPLYNGNISSMGANIRGLSNPLLYNYQYDQLNRLVHMDAWNRTGTAWSAITKVPDFQESIAYDPNGNIMGYKRNGNNTFAGKPIGMDSLNYAYTPGTNKLDHITDSVPSGNYTTDIDGQSSGNYQYDSIGELVSDVASGISNITWTVYGKIDSITKSGDTTIKYTYDPGGNRISKAVTHAGQTETTWYVRDAQGNVMSVYKAGDPAVHGMHLTQTELHIYGSSRLGILKTNNDVEMIAPTIKDSVPLLGSGDSLIFTRGNKLFELTNHLGNVLATISDKRYGVSTNDSTVNYYTPEVVSANDYYPFGSQQPGRSYTESGVGSYRYGFNGKENDNEVKGDGDQVDYGMRVYDPRIGRFLSVDPMKGKYPELTPYQYASNRPIDGIDQDGLEWEGSNPSTALTIGNLFLPKTMKLTDQQLKETGAAYDKAQMTGTAIGAGLSLDMYTGGRITQFLTMQQLVGAFPHNKASTPEGRALQDQSSKEALTDAFLTWGAGKILGVTLDISISGLRGLARNRFNFAKDFYETAGFAPERASSHISGIDLTKKVTEETYKKGTVLEQWTYLDKEGQPIMGDYYALPGADPSKLGIPLEGRVKTTIVLSEDTKFLQSTSADIKDWTPGSNRELKGGETQLFQTGVKYEVKK